LNSDDLSGSFKRKVSRVGRIAYIAPLTRAKLDLVGNLVMMALKARNRLIVMPLKDARQESMAHAHAHANYLRLLNAELD